jgi:ribosomal protein S27AE
MKSLDEHNAERRKGKDRNWYDHPPEDAHKLLDIACPRCGSAIKANLLVQFQTEQGPTNRAWCSSKNCSWCGDVAV